MTEGLPRIDRFYAGRLRRRYVELWLVVSGIAILALPWPAHQVVQLTLWGPGAHDLRTFLVAMGCGALIVVVGVPLTLGRFRPIIAFLRGEPVDPERVWSVAVRQMPVTVLAWVMAFCTVGDLPPVLLAGHDRGWTVGEYVAAWIVAVLVTLTAGFVFALIGEVALRPVLRDLVLPADFVPRRRWLTIGRRSALANATVMLYLGITVSSLVSAERDRDSAMAVAILATVVATVTFGWLTTWLVSSPIHTRVAELSLVLERIGSGDFGGRVSLSAGDEFDDVGRALNAMSARLGVREAEVRGSRARLTQVADDERRRVERDLRERVEAGLGDLATAMSRLADLLEPQDAAGRDVQRVRESLAIATDEIRRLGHGLYPALLETDGLDAALAEAVRRSPIPATYEESGSRLDRDRAAAVYFCCSEALANAAKHAGAAAAVTVGTTVRAGRLEFRVTDDGVGFTASGDGHGLANMRDRIRAFGGDVEVSSRPGAGTAVTGWVALH